MLPSYTIDRQIISVLIHEAVHRTKLIRNRFCCVSPIVWFDWQRSFLSYTNICYEIQVATYILETQTTNVRSNLVNKPLLVYSVNRRITETFRRSGKHYPDYYRIRVWLLKVNLCQYMQKSSTFKLEEEAQSNDDSWDIMEANYRSLNIYQSPYFCYGDVGTVKVPLESRKMTWY